jgi:hypothetical protein
VQYANTDLDRRANVGGAIGVIGVDTKDTSAWAAMVGYAMKDVATFKAAYSEVDDDGVLGVANTATGSIATAGGQSKLYTEMWWNYGYVSAVGAESYALSAETKFGCRFLIRLLQRRCYKNSVLFSKEELTEIALVASKTFGPLATSLALIHGDREVADVKTTDVQVYLTYNF